jgi:hypothetical protein
MEFKRSVNAEDPFDLAVHVATLANRLGGVVLVGAHTEDAALQYPGISRDYAVKLLESFIVAAKDWCTPSADVRPVIIELPDAAPNVLVAANVTAQVSDVVGVNARIKPSARISGAWLFPIRVGSHTKYLSPAELPMYFDAQARSAALLLLRVSNPLVELFCAPPPPVPVYRATGATMEPGGPLSLTKHTARLQEVSVEHGRAFFEVGPRGHPASIPLRDVLKVWQSTKSVWRVEVRGRIVLDGDPHDAYEPVSG